MPIMREVRVPQWGRTGADLRNACLDPMTFSGLTHVLEMLLAAPPDNKCCHMGALCADAADASSEGAARSGSALSPRATQPA